MVRRSFFILSAWVTRILATNQLVGYEGCNANQKNLIDESYADAKKIFNVVRDANIGWNSTPAVEFLGPLGFNQNFQGVLQGEQDRIQGENSLRKWSANIFTQCVLSQN
jgi:hypothetical protein